MVIKPSMINKYENRDVSADGALYHGVEEIWEAGKQS